MSLLHGDFVLQQSHLPDAMLAVPVHDVRDPGIAGLDEQSHRLY